VVGVAAAVKLKLCVIQPVKPPLGLATTAVLCVWLPKLAWRDEVVLPVRLWNFYAHSRVSADGR
jgi:hypothetical protein